MTPLRGKIYIRFTREQIERREMKGSIIHPDMTEAETSLEIGTVEAVCRLQKFYQPGDRVILHYLIFADGRSRLTSHSKNRGISNPTRLVARLDNGDEIYYGYDGTYQNLSDVYAKFDEDGSILVQKGTVLISEPEEPEDKFTGTLWIPRIVQQRQMEESKYQIRRLLAIHPEDAEEFGLAASDEVCINDLSYEVKIPGRSFYMIRTPHLIYKKKC